MESSPPPAGHEANGAVADDESHRGGTGGSVTRQEQNFTTHQMENGCILDDGNTGNDDICIAGTPAIPFPLATAGAVLPAKNGGTVTVTCGPPGTYWNSNTQPHTVVDGPGACGLTNNNDCGSPTTPYFFIPAALPAGATRLVVRNIDAGGAVTSECLTPIDQVSTACGNGHAGVIIYPAFTVTSSDDAASGNQIQARVQLQNASGGVAGFESQSVPHWTNIHRYFTATGGGSNLTIGSTQVDYGTGCGDFNTGC